MTNTQSPAPGEQLTKLLALITDFAIESGPWLTKEDASPTDRKAYFDGLSKVTDALRAALQTSAAAVPVAWRTFSGETDGWKTTYIKRVAEIWGEQGLKVHPMIDAPPAGNAAPLPHKFWGAGEPDCPPDIKAGNGELHTMRCKVCGDGWRESQDVCFGRTPAPGMAGGVVFKGPNKWTDEEVADGHRGLRWITLEGVQGRPTSHDVMDYLKQRGEAAYCSCDKCKAFFAPHPSPAPQAAGAALEKLLTVINDAWANYERMGEVCPFEGQPMIYAATLEEIHDAAITASGRDAS